MRFALGLRVFPRAAGIAQKSYQDVNRQGLIPAETNARRLMRERRRINAAASFPPMPARVRSRPFNASAGVWAHEHSADFCTAEPLAH
jgi:hypothetical protein